MRQYIQLKDEAVDMLVMDIEPQEDGISVEYLIDEETDPWITDVILEKINDISAYYHSHSLSDKDLNDLDSVYMDYLIHANKAFSKEDFLSLISAILVGIIETKPLIRMGGKSKSIYNNINLN